MRFEAGDATVDGDRFTMHPTDGSAFEHEFWGKMVFDLDKIVPRKKAIPAFIGHNWDINAGVINEFKNDGALEVSGDLIDNEHTRDMKAMKEKGLEWECSLGMDPNGDVEYIMEDVTVKVNGNDFQGPGYVFRGAFHEVSFTHFGAVPGTTADFSKDKKEISVKIFSNFSKESSMSEFSQSDLDKSKKEGQDELKVLFSKIFEASGDKEFAASCVMDGLNFEEAQTKLVEKLKSDAAEKDAEFAKLKADAAKPAADGAAPVTFAEGSAPSGDAPTLDFRQKARKLAAEEKISFRAAYTRMIQLDPKGHAEYKYSKPQEAK